MMLEKKLICSYIALRCAGMSFVAVALGGITRLTRVWSEHGGLEIVRSAAAHHTRGL